MMRRSDPRIRQTINQISHNLESANESAQEGLYSFAHNYISPCFSTIGNCVYTCAAPCLPSRQDRLRRRRRGRAEANFDFYDDWDNDIADDGFLGWGNDELDRLLAGSGLARQSSEQPRRQRAMSYGTRGPRRKGSVLVPDDRHDPTVIPSSSILGFLERFRWRLGARGLKYRPSAADLQEHPGGPRNYAHEEEPLMEATEDAEGRVTGGKSGRNRSTTQSSRETTTSLSSRGDLIPSDEEEDAVPLDDEFAMALGRRGLDSDDLLGQQGIARRSTSGTLSSKTTTSSKASRAKDKRHSRHKSPRLSDAEIIQDVDIASLSDLNKEEERAALEEELKVAKKRKAAQKLALRRGLEQESDKLSSPSPLTRFTTATAEAGHHEPSTQALESVEKPEISDGGRLLRQQGAEYNSQTEPFPPFPITPPAAEPPKTLPLSEPYSQQKPSGNTDSNHQPDPSVGGPGEQSDITQDDID